MTKPYHHGDLKQALLHEAERILESEGIQALTLRAAARGVGVSHTAPQNHFGDLTGLLSELAADGHRRLGQDMDDAMAATNDPDHPLRGMAHAYLAFARDHPGLFTLMFRGERLDASRPALQDAIVATRQRVRDAMLSTSGADNATTPLDLAARATAGWALVHGYTMLMLEGRLKGTLAALPDQDAETFFDAVLDALQLRDN